MSREKKRMCVVCQREEVFQEYKKNKFDKCFDCARKYSGQMHEKFIATLSPEQLALFKIYYKAREDFTSMLILD